MQPGNNSVVYKIIRRYGRMIVDFNDDIGWKTICYIS